MGPSFWLFPHWKGLQRPGSLFSVSGAWFSFVLELISRRLLTYRFDATGRGSDRFHGKPRGGHWPRLHKRTLGFSRSGSTRNERTVLWGKKKNPGAVRRWPKQSIPFPWSILYFAAITIAFMVWFIAADRGRVDVSRSFTKRADGAGVSISIWWSASELTNRLTMIDLPLHRFENAKVMPKWRPVGNAGAAGFPLAHRFLSVLTEFYRNFTEFCFLLFGFFFASRRRASLIDSWLVSRQPIRMRSPSDRSVSSHQEASAYCDGYV